MYIRTYILTYIHIYIADYVEKFLVTALRVITVYLRVRWRSPCLHGNSTGIEFPRKHGDHRQIRIKDNATKKLGFWTWSKWRSLENDSIVQAMQGKLPYTP